MGTNLGKENLNLCVNGVLPGEEGGNGVHDGGALLAGGNEGGGGKADKGEEENKKLHVGLKMLGRMILLSIIDNL